MKQPLTKPHPSSPAYDEGIAAAKAGVSFSECPYLFVKAGVSQEVFNVEWSPRLHAWFAGWDAARKSQGEAP